ncbi:amidohydrolase family protein [Ammoniphilus resinae]|uniref:5-methylthioadenosine/S-adenosylhomocysteine deaminase n=1 Tax=Ammoniphilus resinae TaxID=861532 RepID=A0ABS4GT23_9BACL|nr:amidohydrolase [Ammoniphilus resinae]MBP1933401.1 5-methylthioadenosine/S-adenosylhomocysteine deaminase [Ammoniphilus resinae]
MPKILTNGFVITVNEENMVYRQGAVAFDGDVITYVGEVPEDLSVYDEVIDVRGAIIMPGLVNTHGHAAMSLLRGYADDLPLQEWLETKMWPLEGQFTSEHVKWGTYLSIIEMLRTGTTCFMDMYDHMDQVAEAAEVSGMRAGLARGVIGLCPVDVQKQKLEEAADFAQRWNGKADGRITTMMSPHAPYTCPPDYIRQIVEKAHELDLPIHIHMSESQREVEQNRNDYGLRPPAHLEKLGVFERPTLVAHAVHLTDEEIELLAKYDVKVSHNPISNLKLASGIARVPEMLGAGITVSLGTDSSASNNNLNLFEEIKMAALLHKGVSYNPVVVPAEEALRMGTRYGAEAMFIGKQTGSLEAGKKADIIVVRTDRAHFHPLHDPVSHLVYATSGYDVKDVYVNGKMLVDNGEIKTLDEEKIIYETNRMFDSLEK